MGLLEDAMSMLGGQGGGNIMDQVKGMASKAGIEALSSKFPEVGNMLKGVDEKTLNSIINEVTKNGIPDSLDDIKAIVGKFIK